MLVATLAAVGLAMLALTLWLERVHRNIEMAEGRLRALESRMWELEGTLDMCLNADEARRASPGTEVTYGC